MKREFAIAYDIDLFEIKVFKKDITIQNLGPLYLVFEPKIEFEFGFYNGIEFKTKVYDEIFDIDKMIKDLSDDEEDDTNLSIKLSA